MTARVVAIPTATSWHVASSASGISVSLLPFPLSLELPMPKKPLLSNQSISTTQQVIEDLIADLASRSEHLDYEPSVLHLFIAHGTVLLAIINYANQRASLKSKDAHNLESALADELKAATERWILIAPAFVLGAPSRCKCDCPFGSRRATSTSIPATTLNGIHPTETGNTTGGVLVANPSTSDR